MEPVTMDAVAIVREIRDGNAERLRDATPAERLRHHAEAGRRPRERAERRAGSRPHAA